MAPVSTQYSFSVVTLTKEDEYNHYIFVIFALFLFTVYRVYTTLTSHSHSLTVTSQFSLGLTVSLKAQHKIITNWITTILFNNSTDTFHRVNSSFMK